MNTKTHCSQQLKSKVKEIALSQEELVPYKEETRTAISTDFLSKALGGQRTTKLHPQRGKENKQNQLTKSL